MDIVETFETAARSRSITVIRSSPSDLDRIVSDLLHSKRAWGIVNNSTRVFLEEFARVDAAEADGCVIDAEWGIASTGSLVLPSAPDEWPPVNIVILAAQRIVLDSPSTFGDVMNVCGDRDVIVVIVIEKFKNGNA